MWVESGADAFKQSWCRPTIVRDGQAGVSQPPPSPTPDPPPEVRQGVIGYRQEGKETISAQPQDSACHNNQMHFHMNMKSTYDALLCPFLCQRATYCHQLQLSPGFLPSICHNSQKPSSQVSPVFLETPMVFMQQTSATGTGKPWGWKRPVPCPQGVYKGAEAQAQDSSYKAGSDRSGVRACTSLPRKWEVPW